MSTNAAADEAQRSPQRTARGAVASSVAAMIRDAIVNGKLLPGEQVRQQEWAEKARVSRPPIREALEVLAFEGLLEHSPHRGYFVARISLHEMHQLYLMRMLLERATAESVVWPSHTQMAELSELAAKAGAAKERHDHAAHREFVEQFLIAVHRLSSNQLIVQAVIDLWARTSAYRTLAFGAVEHGRIGDGTLDAILKALYENDRNALCEELLRPTIDTHDYIGRAML
ncbi:GntR family transcriptional regulator [Pseudonocardia sp. CA-142604]|uniref:GntR family transcriptional regulator n=1 Tax=Pseudonocardia sp. CA-142604 TaxID=3240024 RepID=UPI003D91CDEA